MTKLSYEINYLFIAFLCLTDYDKVTKERLPQLVLSLHADG